MAVVGSNGDAMTERWNGRRWSIKHARNPARGVAPVADFAGVACTSASACTAVGNYGHVSQELPLAERWNGRDWSVEHTPTRALGRNAFAVFAGVSCVSASACTAVGYHGSYRHLDQQGPLAERWNGRRWSIEHAPVPAGATMSNLTSVSCSSASACTAVGYWGHYRHPSQQWPLAERWNGRRWTVEHTPTRAQGRGAFAVFASVACMSATACTAVGHSYNNSVGPQVTLAEHWDGRRWSIKQTPVLAGATVSNLNGVSCSSASACTAVGDSDNSVGPEVTLAERWNGRRWSIQHTANQPADDSLAGVSCPSAGSCTAVGDYSVQAYCNSTPCSTPDPLAERWTRG